LAAVVSNVFGKNMNEFKGIFTEEEEDLVAALDLTKASSKDPDDD